MRNKVWMEIESDKETTAMWYYYYGRVRVSIKMEKRECPIYPTYISYYKDARRGVMKNRSIIRKTMRISKYHEKKRQS